MAKLVQKRDSAGNAVVNRAGEPVMIPFSDVARFDYDSPLIQAIDRNLQQVPGLPTLAGIAARFNNNVMDTIDFLGTGTINEILKLSGSGNGFDALSDTAKRKLGLGGSATEFVGDNAKGRILDYATDVGSMAIPGQAGIRAAVKTDDLMELTSETGQSFLRARNPVEESSVDGLRRALTDQTPTAAGAEGFVTGVAGQSFTELAGQDTMLTETGRFAAEITGSIIATATGRSVRNRFGDTTVRDYLGDAAKTFEDLFSSPSVFAESIKNSLTYDNEISESILYRFFQRSGKSTDEIISQYETMLANSSETMPADIDTAFRGLLRALTNKHPSMMGRSDNILEGRRRQQSDRFQAAVSGEAGIPFTNNINDELDIVRKARKPEINQRYLEAKQTEVPNNHPVRKIFEPITRKTKTKEGEVETRIETTLSKAWAETAEWAANRAARGEPVNFFERVDLIKRKLDDRYSAAMDGIKPRINEAREIMAVKKDLIEKADAAFPEYAAARKQAGELMELESAGELGTIINKMKPRDLELAIKGFSEEEMRMFRLGVKQHYLDFMDNAPENIDTLKRMFKSANDIRKLRLLFPKGAEGDKHFASFREYLNVERDFAITDRIVRGNSTTVRQLQDADALAEDSEGALAIVEQMTTTMGRINLLQKVMGSLRKQNDIVEQARGELTAARILTHQGYPPEKLKSILERGDSRFLAQQLAILTFDETPGLTSQGLKNASVAEYYTYLANAERERRAQNELQSQLPN